MSQASTNIPGGKGRKGYMSRVKENAKRESKLDKKLLEPQVINLNRVKDELTTSKDGKKKEATSYSVAASNIGHWLQPDPRDTDMKIRRGVAARPSTFGKLQAGQEVIDYIKDKKEREAYLTNLALAEYLIDNKNPETQEKAYAIFPELQKVPDEYYQTWLATQEALRTLLRDGQIRGKEDNALIAKICRDDFQLPELPAWDPTGIIVGKLPQFADIMRRGYKRGIFNPRQWGLGDTVSEELKNDQRRMKYLILKRLYPGLRDAGEPELKRIVEKISAVYHDQPMDNDPWDMTEFLYPDNWNPFQSTKLGKKDPEEEEETQEYTFKEDSDEQVLKLR
jgi:hypothetical protein